MKNKDSLLIKALIYAIMTLVVICVAFPLLYTVASSFKTNSEILAHPERIFPEKFSMDNYITAWTSSQFPIARMLWNSIYYTLICVVVTLISSSAAGYVFARGHFPLQKLIFALFSSLMFITIGSITIYPMFDILTAIHVNKSLQGLIVVKIFSVSIVNIYLVRSYVNTLPRALDEAAKLDGCSFTGIFFRIIAPLLKPILATIGILAFQSSWNDYLLPTIFTINSPQQRTLIVGVVALKTSGQNASQWNLMLAGATISLIPVLGAYALGNKYIVSGLASGAVKG